VFAGLASAGRSSGSRRTRRPVVLIAAVAAAVRLAATFGEPVGSYWDSPDYFRFALWGGERSPVVTGLYALLDSPRAIVTVQALVGAACWSAAGLVLAASLPDGRRRGVCVAAVGLLGVTRPVASWDNALLSESLAISTGVLALALLVRATFTRARPRWTLALALAASAVWMLCRPNNAWICLFLFGALSGFTLVAAVRRRPLLIGRRVLGAFGATAVVLTGMSLANDHLRTRNAVQVIEHRIFGTPEEPWFVARGMPDDGPAIAAGAEDAAESPLGVSRMVLLLEDPDFGAWARRDASASYSRFVLQHPGWVVDNALGDRSAYLGLVSGSVYGASRGVVPGPVEEILWPTGWPVFVVVLVLLGAAVAVGPLRAPRSAAERRGIAFAVAVLAAVAMDGVFILHSAGDEYPRLLMVPACLARLVLVWLVLDGAPAGRSARVVAVLRRALHAGGGRRAEEPG
jgi:hypothetical protein